MPPVKIDKGTSLKMESGYPEGEAHPWPAGLRGTCLDKEGHSSLGIPSPAFKEKKEGPLLPSTGALMPHDVRSGEAAPDPHQHPSLVPLLLGLTFFLWFREGPPGSKFCPFA